jgi:AraC-like DNA-binding protein
MDALGGFLDGPRAKGAFLLRSILEPPWSLRIQDEAPLTVVAVVQGSAYLAFDGDEPQALGPGDVAVVGGPDPYTVSDDPGRPPDIVIHPGQHCTTPDGVSLAEAMTLGVRTWGNSATGSVVMLTGTYETAGEVSRRLLDALPRLVVLAADTWTCPVVPLLADEIVRDEPGQEAVLDRLLDLLLVAALRAAFARGGAAVPAWYQAYGDPVVGRALRLMHNDPAQGWTVAGLAAEAGVSRAALARRFNELVGEPPMAFLTGWRLALAADLLLEPGVTVSGVARQVGYGSPFTFSTAFKRAYGASPRAYRTERQSAPRDLAHDARRVADSPAP